MTGSSEGTKFAIVVTTDSKNRLKMQARNLIVPRFRCHFRSIRSVSHLECMAGTTGLEPATSAVTAKRKVVTYRKQASRMAPFGAVRYDREPLSNPYQTHDLCPVNLCPLGDSDQRAVSPVTVRQESCEGESEDSGRLLATIRIDHSKEQRYCSHAGPAARGLRSMRQL